MSFFRFMKHKLPDRSNDLKGRVDSDEGGADFMNSSAPFADLIIPPFCYA